MPVASALPIGGSVFELGDFSFDDFGTDMCGDSYSQTCVMNAQGDPLYDHVVQLHTAYGRGGYNYAKTAAWTSIGEEIVYGSSTDSWGLNLTPELVNSQYFGVLFQVRDGFNDVTDLMLMNSFGFAIPRDARVTGIEVHLTRKTTAGEGQEAVAAFDCCVAYVYYEFAGFAEIAHAPKRPKKHFDVAAKMAMKAMRTVENGA